MVLNWAILYRMKYMNFSKITKEFFLNLSQDKELVFNPLSFSTLNTYLQCPRKFKYQKIDNLPRIQGDMTALLKGGAVHSLIEHYPEPSTHKYAPQYKHILDEFLDSAIGQKYLLNEGSGGTHEFKFAVNPDLNIVPYTDKSAFFRGIIDYICVIDGVVHVIDFKTGKYREEKWQDYNQLLFYSVIMFLMYPKIEDIKISYVYVEHNLENPMLLQRKFLGSYIKELLSVYRDIYRDVDFKKNITRLCDWCDYQEHCQKSG